MRQLLIKVKTFGYAAFGSKSMQDPLERGRRHIEEAIELVQAVGLPKEQVQGLVEYVYNRPVGDIGQEISGSLFTLNALAGACGYSLEAEAERELERVAPLTKMIGSRAKDVCPSVWTLVAGHEDMPKGYWLVEYPSGGIARAYAEQIRMELPILGDIIAYAPVPGREGRDNG